MAGTSAGHPAQPLLKQGCIEQTAQGHAWQLLKIFKKTQQPLSLYFFIAFSDLALSERYEVNCALK